MNHRAARLLTGALAIVLLPFTGPVSSAQAVGTTLIVTTTADSGAGSLREAITLAQVTADDDTITFDPTVFASGSLHTITLASTLPTISKPLTIAGPGQNVLAISGNDTVRVFFIDQGNNTAPGVRVSMSDLTVTHGWPGSAGEDGGAIRAKRCQLTITRVTVSHSRGDDGGGVFSESTRFTAIDSIFEDNTARYGGAILNNYSDTGEVNSFIDLQGSTFRRNSAAYGGAIFAARPLILTNSVVTQNSATIYGGGVTVAYGYVHTITGSTLTVNTAPLGGAIVATGMGETKGMLTVSGSTITGNTATTDHGGGGIYMDSAILKILNSTLDNGAQGNCRPNWYTSGNTLSYSNLTDTTGSTISDNTCSQFDRAVLITSFTAAANGTTSIVRTYEDPPFLIGDTVRICQRNSCTTTGTKTGTVTSVSAADDTFAVTALGAISAWNGSTGQYGAAWVNLPKIASVTPADGGAAGGTAVTISGTGFGNPAATPAPSVGVTLGGVPASSFTLVDDSTIQAVTPAGRGSVAVGVTSNAVTAAPASTSLLGAFTFISPDPEPIDPIPASAPRDVIATGGNASASIAWSDPESSGSYPVTNYQATSLPGRHTCLVAAPLHECTITGLTNGTTYTFTLQALTGAGWSQASQVSNSVVPAPASQAMITITGSRAGRMISVDGTTTGLVADAVVTPWSSKSGADFAPGRPVLVSADGTFAWSRRANAAETWRIYFTSTDGGRSQIVTISAR